MSEEIAGLSTEAGDPALTELDHLPTVDVVAAVVRGHDEVLAAVQGVEADIARLAEAVAERMDRGGRVIYAGAGSGGRIAQLDASEWGPTFSVPDGMVMALVAGAAHLPGSAEEAAAEDDYAAGAAAVRSLGPGPGDPLHVPDDPDQGGGPSPSDPTNGPTDPALRGGPGPHDVVIGVSASGRTPYVLGAIEAAAAAGALTAAVTSHPGSKLAAAVDVAIEVPVGPEVISGSTRLKAGTAQKLVLNAFSTAVMVRRGRTLGNLMVGMRVANEKLRGRAAGVCVAATGCTDAEARAALAAAGDDLAVAVVSLLREVSADEARRRLAATGGAVRAALRANWS
jgi:N-acetylmuramic acid 6-phosphate etherase